MSRFQRLLNYLRTRKEHRRVIKELNMLSSQELADIGFTRGEINDLIWTDEDIKKRGS